MDLTEEQKLKLSQGVRIRWAEERSNAVDPGVYTTGLVLVLIVQGSFWFAIGLLIGWVIWS